jgi:hypothetical protein
MSESINITDTRTADEFIVNANGQIVLLNETPRQFPFKLVMDFRSLVYDVDNHQSIFLWFETSFPQPSPFLNETWVVFDYLNIGQGYNYYCRLIVYQDGNSVYETEWIPIPDKYFEVDYDGSVFTLKDINGNILVDMDGNGLPIVIPDDHATVGYVAWNPLSINGSPTGSATMTFQELAPIPTPSPLSDVATNIINSVSSVLGSIATAIAANAGVIGSIIVVGAVAIGIMGFGQKIFGGLSGWFKGLF